MPRTLPRRKLNFVNYSTNQSGKQLEIQGSRESPLWQIIDHRCKADPVLCLFHIGIDKPNAVIDLYGVW